VTLPIFTRPLIHRVRGRGAAMCTVMLMPEERGGRSECRPAGPPVKNTFIHFDLEAFERADVPSGKETTRCLRRSRTDPHSPPPPTARPAAPVVLAPPLQLPEAPKEACCTSLNSTPRARAEEETPPRGASTPSTFSWPCSTPPDSPQLQPLKFNRQPLPPLPPLPSFPLAPDDAEELPEKAGTSPPMTSTPTPIALAEEIPLPDASTGVPPAPWWHAAAPAAAVSAAPGSVKVPVPSPIPASGHSPASPFLLFNGGGVVFGFTLRKAFAGDLGLDVVPSDGNTALLVQGVQARSAIESWNRQVVGSPNAGKAVVPGDKLVCVNAVYGNCAAMTAESQEKMLVKLLFARGGLDCLAVFAKLAAFEKRSALGVGGRGSRVEAGLQTCEQMPAS